MADTASDSQEIAVCRNLKYIGFLSESVKWTVLDQRWCRNLLGISEMRCQQQAM